MAAEVKALQNRASENEARAKTAEDTLSSALIINRELEGRVATAESAATVAAEKSKSLEPRLERMSELEAGAVLAKVQYETLQKRYAEAKRQLDLERKSKPVASKNSASLALLTKVSELEKKNAALSVDLQKASIRAYQAERELLQRDDGFVVPMVIDQRLPKKRDSEKRRKSAPTGSSVPKLIIKPPETNPTSSLKAPCAEVMQTTPTVESVTTTTDSWTSRTSELSTDATQSSAAAAEALLVLPESLILSKRDEPSKEVLDSTMMDAIANGTAAISQGADISVDGSELSQALVSLECDSLVIAEILAKSLDELDKAQMD